jgi:hypothetical protein
MRILHWFIFLVVLFSSLLIYHWQNNINIWQNTPVKKNIIDWNQGLAVGLIGNNNNYKIKILDSNSKTFINLDDWNVETLLLDHDLTQLKKLNKDNSVIYIIVTKFPIEFFMEYLEQKKIIAKSPFIIINESYDKALIHKYFFNKSKIDNDFIYISAINLNHLIDNNMDLDEYIQENNYQYLFLFANRDRFKVNKLLKKYQEKKRKEII